jgi:microcompartment protein CcmK/EutM
LVIDEGNGARQILGIDPGAVRAVIVGVVDEVTISEVAEVISEPYSVSI